MVDPQSITYASQFQAPDWHDNVDLVSAGAPNGVNAQFRNLQAELNTLKGVVQQLSTAISSINQALSAMGAAVISANATVDATNNTINTANNTISTANSTIGTANDSAGAATAYGTCMAEREGQPAGKLHRTLFGNLQRPPGTTSELSERQSLSGGNMVSEGAGWGQECAYPLRGGHESG
jgi:prophage DNA circulation protein